MSKIKMSILLVVLALWSLSAFGGSYVDIDDKVSSGINVPFAIVHPVGYNGAGGQLAVKVCIDFDSSPKAARLMVPLQNAISTWNTLVPTLQNCSRCMLLEDTSPLPEGRIHAETVILHELGHCAMGLNHINIDQAPLGPASFTKSVGATAITDNNGIPGDLEDLHSPALNVQDMAWFRTIDNNPFAIDSIVIDDDSFSRSVAADLPAGHGYAASANLGVGAALGFANSQAVMYSGVVREMKNISLAPDDVNMIRMGMAGADLMAGTADDYTVVLSYLNQCDGTEDIKVEFFDLSSGVFGRCFQDIGESFSQGLLKFHWSVVPPMGSSVILISLNDNENWDFGDEVFSSGFESGDFSEWSLVVQ